MSEITHWPGPGARIERVFRYPSHLQRRLIRSSSKTANAVWISDCALNVQYARGLHSGRLVTRSHTALHLDDVKSFVAVTNTNKQAQQSSRDRRLGISNLVMRSLIRLRRAFIRFLSEIKQKIYSKIRGLCHLSLTGSFSLSLTHSTLVRFSNGLIYSSYSMLWHAVAHLVRFCRIAVCHVKIVVHTENVNWTNSSVRRIFVIYSIDIFVCWLHHAQHRAQTKNTKSIPKCQTKHTTRPRCIWKCSSNVHIIAWSLPQYIFYTPLRCTVL